VGSEMCIRDSLWPEHVGVRQRTMKAAIWKQGTQGGTWSTTFRGIGIIIRVDKNGSPTEIEFFIGGRRVESAPVSCTVEQAKTIALQVVDRQIAEDAAWANAEYRHNRDIWKKQ